MTGSQKMPSREQVEKTIEDTYKFLQGVSRSPHIFKKLEAQGYNRKEHIKGWTYLISMMDLHQRHLEALLEGGEVQMKKSGQGREAYI